MHTCLSHIDRLILLVYLCVYIDYLYRSVYIDDFYR